MGSAASMPPAGAGTPFNLFGCLAGELRLVQDAHMRLDYGRCDQLLDMAERTFARLREAMREEAEAGG